MFFCVHLNLNIFDYKKIEQGFHDCFGGRVQYINYDLFCVSINNEINVFTHLFWSFIFVLDDNSVVENFTLLEKRKGF